MNEGLRMPGKEAGTEAEKKKVDIRTTGLFAGVTLDVGGQTVNLISDTPLNEMDTKGFELLYPEDAPRISVITGDIVDGIAQEITGKSTYSVQEKIDAAKIPIVGPLASTILKGRLTFEKMHLKIPSKASRVAAITAINVIQPNLITQTDIDAGNIPKTALSKIITTQGTDEQIQAIRAGQTSQTFSMSLTFGDTGTNTIGGLSITGIYLGITNEMGNGEYGNDLFNLNKKKAITK